MDKMMPPPPVEKKDAPVADEAPEQPKKPSKAIEVVASRPGYFRGRRYSKGDKFSIPSMDKFGKWMEFVDPVLEKERKLSEKRKKRKEYAGM